MWHYLAWEPVTCQAAALAVWSDVQHVVVVTIVEQLILEERVVVNGSCRDIRQDKALPRDRLSLAVYKVMFIMTARDQVPSTDDQSLRLNVTDLAYREVFKKHSKCFEFLKDR